MSWVAESLAYYYFPYINILGIGDKLYVNDDCTLFLYAIYDISVSRYKDIITNRLPYQLSPTITFGAPIGETFEYSQEMSFGGGYADWSYTSPSGKVLNYQDHKLTDIQGGKDLEYQWLDGNYYGDVWWDNANLTRTTLTVRPRGLDKNLKTDCVGTISNPLTDGALTAWVKDAGTSLPLASGMVGEYTPIGAAAGNKIVGMVHLRDDHNNYYPQSSPDSLERFYYPSFAPTNSFNLALTKYSGNRWQIGSINSPSGWWEYTGNLPIYTTDPVSAVFVRHAPSSGTDPYPFNRTVTRTGIRLTWYNDISGAVAYPTKPVYITKISQWRSSSY